MKSFSFFIRGTDIDDIILNTLGAFLGLKLLNLLEKRFSNFFNKFAINEAEDELTSKEKRSIYIITILQAAMWIIMIVNLKQMAIFLNTYKMLYFREY